MELVAKVEEEACRLARKTARGGKGEVGGNQEVIDVVCVDVTRDGGVVAGGTGVFQDSAVVGSKPEKTEDSRIQVGIGGSEVMNGEMRLGHFLDFRKMEGGGGRVADGQDGAGVKSSFGNQIVVGRGRVLGGAERACIDYCPLKFST